MLRAPDLPITADPPTPPAVDAIAVQQAGVVSRQQALRCGLTEAAIAAQIAAGRWQRLLRGTYGLTSHGLSRLSLLWAVVLRMGNGAILSHETAAELHGLVEPSAPIHITVPDARTPGPVRGIVIHRSVRAIRARHPSRTPPQTTVEDTVLDLTQTAPNAEDASGWIAKAIGARLTTPDRLARAMSDRRKLRWRRPLSAALRDVAAGCHSLLELIYLRDVERAHGLPRGERQVRRVSDRGTTYEDVVYRDYDTVIELDGRVAHPDRFRDMTRDNATVAEGRAPLRYGFNDVHRQPCAVAVQVGGVLRRRGWRGRLRRCRRPDCVVVEARAP